MSARKRRRKRRRIVAGAGVSIGAALGSTGTAEAADFTVTTLADSGGGSLRQALLDANAAPGADRILFQSSLSGTINLTTGQLEVFDAVEVVGPGADKLSITESGPQGILSVSAAPAGMPVTISGLKLTGANASFGAAVIAHDTHLTLLRTIITGNTTVNAGTIYSYGTASRLTVDSSALDGNNGGDFAGALSLRQTKATITNSTISGNTVASSGGAIYSAGPGSTLSLDGVTIAGNNGGDFAGALSLDGTKTTIKRSTISGNRASSAGAGIYSTGLAELTVDTSTISGNFDAGFGGALIVNGGATTFTNSTVAGNSARTLGGGIYAAGTTPSLSNSVIADNTAPAGPDLAHNSGSFNAAFSLIENPGGVTINSTGPNVTGQDPNLGPLADNGGPTRTHALLPGSPALDTGSTAGNDQRGAPRPFDLPGIALAPGGNGADIGAYERVLCARRVVNRVGTAGNDALSGTPGADGILALGGKDKLKGLAGKDSLCGGPGADKLKGGKGNDRLLGQAGKDTLIGGKGKDKLKGGKGRDTEKQ